MNRRCEHCRQGFEVLDRDQEFYERISPAFNNRVYPLLLPSLCPQCRYCRRIAFRNERRFYRRRCDLSSATIVSIYSEHNPSVVYAQRDWWGDSWDPLDYGRSFDFTKLFFDQFLELKMKVPRPAVTNHNSENSEYTNQAQDNKNCYFLTSSGNNEECLYGHWLQKNRCSVDCLMLKHCELCYECVYLAHCYNCKWAQNSSSCSDCVFCYDCRGCSSCIGCLGLQNKQYYIFNKQSTKSGYQAFVGEHLNSREGIENTKQTFEEKLNAHPRKYYTGRHNEHFTGDYLLNSKNAFHSFNVTDSEDVSYLTDSGEDKLCFDTTETLGNVMCYELQGSAFCNRCLFCSQCWHIYDAMYCDIVFSSGNCFGCVGLKHHQHCILNQQFSQAEYEKLVSRIIEHMMETGEWGQFFPPRLSPFGYNETVAAEYFPLSREEALKSGLHWSDYESPPAKAARTLAAAEIPNTIADVSGSVLDFTIACEVTDKPFRITTRELEFYRKQNIPLPTKDPEERHLARMALRNPRRLAERTCHHCGAELVSTYPPDAGERILCEACYYKEAY